MSLQLFSGAEIEPLLGDADRVGSAAGTAVLVEHGRIRGIGGREPLLAEARSAGWTGEIEEIDLGGAVLMPGFVDGHAHMELSCITQEQHLQLHAPPITSVTQILAAIEERRRAQSAGWIIVRSSFSLGQRLREGRLPQRDELDRVSPGEPVVVLAGLHVAVLNTPAMLALSLDDESQYRRGMTVHRHPDGSPSGVFTEVWDRLPTASESEVVAAIRRRAGGLFSAHGTTSLSTIPTSAADVRALQALRDSGELPFRVRFYPHVPRVGSVEELLSLGAASGFGDDMLRFGGIKIFVDGEGGDGIGAVYDDLKWEQSELEDLVRQATDARVQLFMHAVTETGIRAVIAAVRAQHPAALAQLPAPHRIEHAGDYVPIPLIGELAASGVGVVATPHFVSSEVVPPDFQPLRGLVDAGIAPIGATDTTGTVPQGASPLYNIASMVNRVDANGDPSRHRLSVGEAVRMFTTWSAAGQGEGAEKGVLRPGALADFAVLDENPFRVASERIADIAVLRSYLGGRAV